MKRKGFLKSLATFIAVVFLTSCNKDAQQKQVTTNPEFTIELLFEKDGCKIYRFQDGGRNIYWTNCTGKIQYDETHLHSNGKTTSSSTEHFENETK